ncbi:ADP-ribosylation factor-like protein 9 isoform X4 [Symphalangus syndactylus]|uniref:ADP-ribosylation factor-like protein 9 isoform X4 n=1 Tax=Symphalangus syndactylus TaxID=9590 RepID=UPI0024426C28|nr:ADP-ribosylation factor-like protein 9 isoform X4 [Symphalangus syndactylus]
MERGKVKKKEKEKETQKETIREEGREEKVKRKEVEQKIKQKEKEKQEKQERRKRKEEKDEKRTKQGKETEKKQFKGQEEKGENKDSTLTRTPLEPLDLEAAYHITDIHEALALSEVGNDRKMFLFGTHLTKNGSEIPSTMQDAKDLIAQLAADVQ